MNKTNVADLFDSLLEADLDGFSIFEDDDTPEEEEDIENGVTVQGRYILDGAESLEDAAFMARAYAEYLETLHEQGFVLKGIVTADYGIATLG